MNKFAKENLIKHYKTQLEKMFSDKDIERNLGQNSIIKYSELADYNNINELLPHDKSFKVILIESKFNSGHWVCVMKYKDIIEYFNSYGSLPEYDFKFIPTHIKYLLGQGGNLLTKLLKTKNSNQKIYYNKKKLQKINNSVNTCGRWVCCRIIAMLCGYELDDFIEKCEEKKSETGKPYDILVTEWIK